MKLFGRYIFRFDAIRDAERRIAECMRVIEEVRGEREAAQATAGALRDERDYLRLQNDKLRDELLRLATAQAAVAAAKAPPSIIEAPEPAAAATTDPANERPVVPAWLMNMLSGGNHILEPDITDAQLEEERAVLVRMEERLRRVVSGEERADS